MHERSKGFSFEGQCADKDLARFKDIAQGYIEEEMREKGYVPILDIFPDWTVDYMLQSRFNYKMTMYAKFVGKVKSRQITGIMEGKPIWNTTNFKS